MQERFCYNFDALFEHLTSPSKGRQVGVDEVSAGCRAFATYWLGSRAQRIVPITKPIWKGNVGVDEVSAGCRACVTYGYVVEQDCTD